ncbi:MAG: hypothetical protein U1F43_04265 [Myxococcota bacterium]
MRSVLMAVAVVLAAGPAQAGDKDTSGQLESWVVTKDGSELLGTETLRVVVKDDGQIFAAGEAKETLGKKKIHLKTTYQRGADGDIGKYQRVENGLKGAGLRVFAFEGQLRVAPVNGNGKPSALGKVATNRVWDADLWHLFALWGLPSSCEGTKKLAYLDPDKKAVAEATLTCTGSEKIYDAQKKPVTVGVWHVSGVAHEVDLLVDAQGKLAGVKGADRRMLRAKWVWTADEKAVGTGDGSGGSDDEVDPGIGE